MRKKESTSSGGELLIPEDEVDSQYAVMFANESHSDGFMSKLQSDIYVKGKIWLQKAWLILQGAFQQKYLVASVQARPRGGLSPVFWRGLNSFSPNSFSPNSDGYFQVD